MSPPTLSSEQRSAATAKAVANRRRRAQIKEQLRTGDLTWQGVLELVSVDEVVATMRVQEVLLALPGVGPRRLERFMRNARVAQTRRMRGLGQHQIAALNAELGS